MLISTMGVYSHRKKQYPTSQKMTFEKDAHEKPQFYWTEREIGTGIEMAIQRLIHVCVLTGIIYEMSSQTCGLNGQRW